MSDKPRVLVYGAAGAQGSAIARRLTADGFAVRGLARNGDTSALARAGAEVVRADLDDRDALAAASAGCDRVVFLLPLAFDVAAAERWTHNALAAATAAKVGLFVFDTSAPVPDAEPGVAAIDVKVRAERLVCSAALPWLILRPTIYMDNLAAPWSAPGIARDRIVAYPLPADQAVAWISWDETAAQVAAAIADPSLAGRAFDLGGPEALTGPALAAAFDTARGPGHRYAQIPLAGFAAGLNAALGEPVGTEIARLYGWLAGEGRASLAPAPSRPSTGAAVDPIAAWIGRQDWS